MKRFFGIILTAFLAISLCTSPDVTKAEELPEYEFVTIDGEEAPEVTVETLGALSGIQPYAASTRTIYNNFNFIFDDVYSYTIQVTVTFTFGRPDNVVYISYAGGFISKRSDNSLYYPGSVGTSYYNGTPARVTTTNTTYRKSDSKAVGDFIGRTFLYNDGTFK